MFSEYYGVWLFVFPVKKLGLNKPVVVLLLFAGALLSLSRTLALVHYFGEPTQDVWKHAAALAENHPGFSDYRRKGTTTICTGNDWFRFPGHFFLTESTQSYYLNKESTSSKAVASKKLEAERAETVRRL